MFVIRATRAYARPWPVDPKYSPIVRIRPPSETHSRKCATITSCLKWQIFYATLTVVSVRGPFDFPSTGAIQVICRHYQGRHQVVDQVFSARLHSTVLLILFYVSGSSSQYHHDSEGVGLSSKCPFHCQVSCSPQSLFQHHKIHSVCKLVQRCLKIQMLSSTISVLRPVTLFVLTDRHSRDRQQETNDKTNDKHIYIYIYIYTHIYIYIYINIYIFM